MTKHMRKILIVPAALFAVAAFGCSTDAGDDEAKAKTATTVEDSKTAATVPAPTTTTVPPAPTTTTVPPATTTTVPENPQLDNAVRSAESYLEFMGFSRQGLIDQLSSEFGDQYPVDVATQAVDSLNVDWNEQAVIAAQSYLDFSGFSHAGLVDQLSSEYGDQFTPEEAEHGATVALGGL